jgi:hypothetical protein
MNSDENSLLFKRPIQIFRMIINQLPIKINSFKDKAQHYYPS